MSPLSQRHVAALMILYASSSFAIPLVGKPSFGRAARNLLPFRCDVVPGDHAGLVDGINCEWDWWAHTADDFEPQSTDQWETATVAPTHNETDNTPFLDSSCQPLPIIEGPKAVNCTFGSTASHDFVVNNLRNATGAVLEKCSRSPYPITCIYSRADHENCEHEHCQKDLRARTEHEWEHFDTLAEEMDYLAEHPDFDLKGCKHVLGDAWCYFESPEPSPRALLSKFARSASPKRNGGVQKSPTHLSAADLGLDMHPRDKRTFGCEQTHDYRCDFFDNGILKHAICVFSNSADKELYVKTHDDFDGRPALCNLVNSGPGMVCGFDLKGSLLPAKPRQSKDAAARSPRSAEVASYDSTMLIESIWLPTTSKTMSTSTWTSKTVISGHTVTDTAVVDVEQSSTFTSRTTMSTPMVQSGSSTVTSMQTIFQFTNRPLEPVQGLAPSTSTTTTTTCINDGCCMPKATHLPCQDTRVMDAFAELTQDDDTTDDEDQDGIDESCLQTTVSQASKCTETSLVKNCLQKNNDELKRCNEQDNFCTCRAYTSRVHCFDSCPEREDSREEARAYARTYCARAKAIPPSAGVEVNRTLCKSGDAGKKSGAMGSVIPLSAAIMAAVMGVAGLWL